MRSIQYDYEGVHYPLIQLMSEIKGLTRFQTLAEMQRAYQGGLDWKTIQTGGKNVSTLDTFKSTITLHQMRSLAHERNWIHVAKAIDRRISELRDGATRVRSVHGIPRALESMESVRRSGSQRRKDR